jgi:hypothetical protein
MKKINPILIFIIWPHCLFSQINNDFFNDLSAILEKTLYNYKDYSGYKESYKLTELKNIFSIPPPKNDSLYLKTINDFYNLQTKMYKQDIGLDANASYNENFGGGILDEANIFYNRRFQVGLNWDILQGGLVEHQLDGKQNDLDKKITLLKQENEQNININYKLAYNNIIYQFNKEKIHILEFKEALIDSLLNVYYKMYYLKYTPWEDVLKIMNSKATTDQLISGLSSYNANYDSTYLFNFEAEKLPVVNVLVDSILKINAAYAMPYLDSIHDLKKQKLAYKYNLWKDVSLSTYIRYNLFVDTTAYRNFFTAGVNFSIPIPFFIGKKKKLKTLETNIIDLEHESVKNREDQEISNINYEYQYKLKQYIDLLYKQKIRQELVRKEISKLNTQNPDYSPIAILKLIDEIISVNYEIIDLKQLLYLNLLKIYHEAELKNIDDFSRVFEYDESFKSYQAKKSLYVWSSDFLKYDNKYIQELCLANRVNNLIISTGNNEKAKIKLDSLVMDNNNKLLITQLFGNNDLIKYSDSEVLDYCETNYRKGCKALHIDVEPHTFNNWDTDKAQLQADYIRMLGVVRTFTTSKGLLLEVSIPLHYEVDFLKQIYALCDKVYLMAYENVKIDFIVRKCQEEISIDKDKTSIAFRPKDFENRYEFENEILKLQSELDVYDVAIHDLGGIIMLEDAVIEKTTINK